MRFDQEYENMKWIKSGSVVYSRQSLCSSKTLYYQQRRMPINHGHPQGLYTNIDIEKTNNLVVLRQEKIQNLQDTIAETINTNMINTPREY